MPRNTPAPHFSSTLPHFNKQNTPGSRIPPEQFPLLSTHQSHPDARALCHSDIDSYACTAELARQVDRASYLGRRATQLQALVESELGGMAAEMEGLRGQVQTAMLHSEESVAQLLQQARELGSGFGDPKQNQSGLGDPIFDKINTQFSTINESLLVIPHSKAAAHTQKLAHNIQQTLEPSLKLEQSDSHQSFLGLVNASNEGIEGLEGRIKQLQEGTQDRLDQLEDQWAAIQGEMEGMVSTCREQGRREDHLVEILIEKLIYKLTYL